jgi:hypothetical protein
MGVLEKQDFLPHFYLTDAERNHSQYATRKILAGVQ